MTHRQTATPTEWLILAERSQGYWRAAVRRLPRGGGVLVLPDLPVHVRREMLVELQRTCKRRGLVLVDDLSGRAPARIHNSRELRRALSNKARIVLLSPVFPTRSHPEWRPLPRMRAATLARLAGRKAIALGGMNRARFKHIQKLGFAGWAGIDAWVRT